MLSIIVIAGIALIGYIWMSRGFFSGLINLACVLGAGAIAFGVWEPLAYFFLEKAPDSGAGAVLMHNAWALALALPFALALAALRGIADGILRANVIIDRIADYVGGAVCGLASGVVTMGMIIISVGFLRIGVDLQGYQPISFNANGSLQRAGSLIVPVDKIVGKMYGALSTRSLATDEPLAKWYPDVHEVPPTLRLTFGEGKARNTIKPRDVSVTGHYAVGSDSTGLGELTSDIWNAQEQNVTDIAGKPVGGPGHLEGFVVRFKSGAKEKAGQIVVGNAQLRLLADDAEGNPHVLHPISIISQASSERVAYGRFRFDSGGSGVHIAGVGGASEVTMGFEFTIPKGWTSRALYVKNVRFEVGKPQATYPGTAERDQGIRDGSLMKVEVDARGPERPAEESGQQNSDDTNEGTRVSNQLQIVIQMGNQGSLEVDENRRIVDGEQVFSNKDLQNWKLIDQQLRISKLGVTPDISIVQVDVSLRRPASWLGRSIQMAENVVPPLLFDGEGQSYEPVGYVYEEQTLTRVRFTPGRPVRALAELPSLSSSRVDQKLTLIFRVSHGVELSSFKLGNETLVTYKPKIKLSEPQR